MSNSSGRLFLTRMGVRNIRTNRTMSVASVLVLLSCLMLIGLVCLAALNLNAFFEEFSSRNIIMVYPYQGQTPEQIKSLHEKILAMPLVKECRYISSQEAFDLMKRQSEQEFALLEGVDPSFMPDGFAVSPGSVDDFGELVSELETMDPAIQRVRHVQGVAAKLVAIERTLTVFGASVVGLLLVVSVFIIASTVRAAMYSRQQEIKVMKSVGAAPDFIRWPFLVEGLLLGLLGAAAALLLVWLLYFVLGRAMLPLLQTLLGGFVPLSFLVQLKWLLPLFFVIGVITGGGGSMLSITRYLKEKVYEQSELEA